jgi:serine/threonine protein kinase
MSSSITPEELIALIRKSEVVSADKFREYLLRRQPPPGIPADASQFADEMVRDGLLTFFQAEQLLLGKWSGFTLGRYKLLERVGVGGMGQVFLCEHLHLGTRVALKILPPAKAEQPAALGRFYREARAASSIDHPNVVRTHDIGHDAGFHFIVMDYVRGPNLLNVVKHFGPMDLGRATSYVRQVAEGLDHAFRGGIIHRDVKPGNILIDRDGHARLLDLGLARFYQDHTDPLTITYDDKIVLGTADYIAPEQVANSHAVDIRADIYALGATLYFLLAGHPPFPTGTVSQKLLWQRTKEPAPIREVRAEVPEGLAAVLAKMMAKEPKTRYQTPAQVSAALAEFVPSVVPLPRPEEMPRLSRAALEGTEEPPPPQEEGLAATTITGAAASATARATRRPITPHSTVPVLVQSEIETPPPAFPTLSEGAIQVPIGIPDTGTAPALVRKPRRWLVIAAIALALLAGAAFLIWM